MRASSLAKSFTGLVAIACLGACGDKNSSADDSATGAEETGSGTDGGEESDTGGEAERIPARGIRADNVEVNQGVAVPIVVDGDWVGPTERTSSIYAGRQTLIRAPWVYEEGWEPREIQAELVFDSPNYEEPLVVRDTKLIEEESYEGDLNRTFSWVVPAEEMVGSVEFTLSLYEVDDSHADEPDPTPLPVAPQSGPELMGIEEQPMELKIVIVPVDYDNEANCQTLPTPDEDIANKFRQALFEHNPVQSVSIEVHDTPIVRVGSLTTLAAFFNPLEEYRVMDGAAPNEYYFALVDACAGGVGGAGGIAPGTPQDTKMAAFGRVSVGLWHKNSPPASYGTCVHEIGHCQGRSHSACPNGGAENPDLDFPNENGKIGVWGFGVETFQLRNPNTNFDYMAYCNPTWVSDYTWVNTGHRIRTLTAWDYESAQPDPVPVAERNEVLVGLIEKNGKESWWTTVGGLAVEEMAPSRSITYRTDTQTHVVGASYSTLEDGTTYVVAPMPIDFENVIGIDRTVAGKVTPIERAKVYVQAHSWDEWHARNSSH